MTTPLYSRGPGPNDRANENLMVRLGIESPAYCRGLAYTSCVRSGYTLAVRRTGMSSGKPYHISTVPLLVGDDADDLDIVEVWYMSADDRKSFVGMAATMLADSEAAT